MNQVRDVLIILASLAMIIFVSDQLATKYNTDNSGMTCINSEVEKTLLEVTTGDLTKELADEGFILETNVLRENTSTEKRDFTVKGKSKYNCNTSIQLNVSANPNNKQSVKIIEKIAKDKKTFTTTIDRDYTVTENDLGTQYWVKSSKIIGADLNLNN